MVKSELLKVVGKPDPPVKLAIMPATDPPVLHVDVPTLHWTVKG